MTLSGSMVFQMQDGATMESWLESWLTEYLKRSGI